MPSNRHSKYGAIPITIDGIRFASQREARRYGELLWLAKANKIRELTLQPKYPLAVADMHGVLEIIGSYRGDFQYVDCQSGELVVEDSKGVRTPLFRWKKRHFEQQYGIKLREV